MASSELIPRAYQEEIFNRARHENIIAALDTGSGKTYIAALLIRWFATQNPGTRKIYAFIVPRVPLVQQQADFLASQIPLTVRSYHGALVDSWQHDPTRWNQEFNECDVMVMTAQVFLDAMLHAHWSMAQVALLIIDEAHHARKNHPYNQILRDFYYTCDPDHRPRVFGMTASPVWHPRNAYISLRTLEQNLHSKVLGVLENKTELLEHSPRPIEIIRLYPVQSISIPEYPLSLWQFLVDLELHSHPVVIGGNLELRYDVTKAEVGPYGADFYLSTHLRALVADLVRKHQYDYMVTQTDAAQTVSFDEISMDSRPSELSATLIQVESILEQFGQSMSFEDSITILPEWLSPKLRVLVSILTERRSSSFQGIVFVEQRQVAATLAWILPRVPELRGWIATGALIGHGIKRGVGSGQGMEDKKQRDTLNSFRAGITNLLISTSVGEEGLDFPACDLIVRYNQLQNMVGYLQSRGRARRFDSTYIVMIPEGSSEEHMRYHELRDSEPEIKRMYQAPRDSETRTDLEEPDDPMDLAARLHYQIPSTGALLTFNSAISLLSNLCALIPRDKYTQVLQPQFSGEFQMTVVLPSALPIPRECLVHNGAVRRRKREAKAAAAFAACKALHELKVFDDYLLPVRKTSGVDIEDADGRPIPEVGKVNEMMDVFVVDPWSPWHCPSSGEVMNPHVWIYPIFFVNQDEPKLALVTTNNLGLMPHLACKTERIQFGIPTEIDRLSESELKALQEYTALGIHWYNTSKKIKNPLACMLALLTSDGGLDIDSMRTTLQNPTRSNGITRENEDHLILRCQLEFGRPLLLRRLREDLTPLSRPIMSDDLAPVGDYATYAEFYETQNKHRRYPIEIPRDGALLQVETYTRNFDSQYCLKDNMLINNSETPSPQKTQRLVPAKLSESFMFPEHARRAFHLLPPVIRRVTDVFRARAAVKQLRLPPLEEDLVIEALTLPCATAGFNNQRLETLGDTVLKLCVVVHLFNAYPFRHEGQLDGMRRNSVSNRLLLARAKEIGLERFLTSEPSAMRKWRPLSGDGVFIDGVWFAKRKFARRSLQDCMEALLGVGFLCGGIDMALHVGTALKLCFGGTDPWSWRYITPEPTPVPLLFDDLQKALGYQFKSGELLIEAITHPSFPADNACYQRLEFLGDALLDLVVMEYLYRKYPNATSGQLTWAKSRAVFAPALTTLGVKRLSLEKYILYNNVDLGKALANATPEHANVSYEEIVMEGWKYDPPKALSDVMESVCGAILVDSGYDYEKSRTIIERIIEPLLEVLRPDLPRDPTSELMLSLARRSCQRARFEKFAIEEHKNQRNDAIRFIVHDVVIGAPFRTTKGGLSRLKPLLAQRVRAQLEDPNSEFYVETLCDCPTNPTNRKQDLKHVYEDIPREELDNEKNEGFAILALLELNEVDGKLDGSDDGEEQDDDEVERLEDDDGSEFQDVEMVHEIPAHAARQTTYEVSDEDSEEDMDIEAMVERMLVG